MSIFKRKNLCVNNLKPADIIFTFNKDSFFSKLIWLVSKFKKNKDFKKPKISHVLLYLGNNLIIESSFGGVAIKNIKAFKKKYKIYIGRCINNFDVDNLKQSCIEQAGITKYAYLQIIIIAIKKLFRLHKVGDFQKDAVHCSEFIAAEFKKVNVDLVPQLHPAETSPLDIYNSNIIKIIDF